MKKIILGLLFICCIQNVNAQMVTEAPATDILLSQQIADGLQNLSVTMDNYEMAKKTLDGIEKVNTYVNQLNLISEMVKKQKSAIDGAQELQKLAKKIKDPKTSQLVLKSVSTSLTNISNSVEMVNKITKDGFFKMNDKERIDLLEKEEQNISRENLKIRSKIFKLRNF